MTTSSYASMVPAKRALQICAFFLAAVSGTVRAQTPDLELWRLDCGAFTDFDISGMSDIQTPAYQGRKKTLVNGCYLIRHGTEYMLWDTGFPQMMVGKFGLTQQTKLTEQLAQLSIRPEQVSIVGISHFHWDHTGQAADFPNARLLIGRGDWDNLVQRNPITMPATLAPWRQPGARVEPVESLTGDKDVFGDGSVVMLRTPGHSPGHHSLLVRLPRTGVVILSGDLWHIAEQRADNGVKAEVSDRANVLASRERVLRLAANLRAKLIIQHEPADVAKLPTFPTSAK